jgi:hypothetical protein
MMSLLAVRPEGFSFPFSFRAFCWTSFAYPVVFLYCAAIAIACYGSRQKNGADVKLAIAPLVYLAVVIAFFVGSTFTGT